MNHLPLLDSCNGCGACCLEQESPPGYLRILFHSSHAEVADVNRVASMPPELRKQLLDYGERLQAGQGHPNNGICLWYDQKTRGCKHYDWRPEFCREFDRGSPECHKWRDRYQIKETAHSVDATP